MAVESRVFRLLEVEEGRRWSVQKPGKHFPVRDFLAAQARFSHFTEADYEAFENEVKEEWDFLMARTSSVTEI
jgi:pyruvate/2-oxoacid:ferredoxin oxidoreductase beta subunit